MQEEQSTVVKAWARPSGGRYNMSLSHVWTGQQPPSLLLERIASHADGVVEFRARKVDDGTPFTDRDLARANLLSENLESGWFILGGSLTAWRTISSMTDTAHGGQMLLKLAPEPRQPQRKYDVTPSWWSGTPAMDPRRQQAEDALSTALKIAIGFDVIFTPACSSAEMSFTLTEGFGGIGDAKARELRDRIKADLEQLKG